MAFDVDLSVEIDRQRPDAESDSTSKTLRGARYGEAYVVPITPPTTHSLADEGSYQVALNPTPGTAIAFVVNTVVSETAGNYLYVKNNDSQGNSRCARIYLDYIRLICTTAPASATSGHFFLKVDNKDRYTSGGTQITPTNVNIDTGTSTVSQMYVGALTTTAPSQSARLIGRGILRSVISVVNDEWVLKFGCSTDGASIGLAGATAQRMVIPCAPLMLGPQDNLCLQLWFPANATTAPQFEVECGWYER